MEFFHLDTRYRGQVTLPPSLVGKLPRRVVLCSVVQYLDQLDQIEEQLKAIKEVTRFRSIHGTKRGQILGCDVYNVPGEFDCFLFVGDGLFHPTALLYENKKPVYSFNPFNGHWSVLEPKDLELVNKRRKAALAKFYAADRVGVVLTTKSGQGPMQTRTARKLEAKFPQKEFFYFVCDTLNTGELENYPFIQAWINTACPRIVEDEALILNISELGDGIVFK